MGYDLSTNESFMEAYMKDEDSTREKVDGDEEHVRKVATSLPVGLAGPASKELKEEHKMEDDEEKLAEFQKHSKAIGETIKHVVNKTQATEANLQLLRTKDKET